MSSYCLKRGENRESKNPKVGNTKNGRIMLLSKCVVCDSKNTKFINEQETRGSKTTDFKWFIHSEYLVLKVSKECNREQAFISRR